MADYFTKPKDISVQSFLITTIKLEKQKSCQNKSLTLAASRNLSDAVLSKLSTLLREVQQTPQYFTAEMDSSSVSISQYTIYKNNKPYAVIRNTSLELGNHPATNVKMLQEG